MGHFMENLQCKLDEEEVRHKSESLAAKLGELAAFQKQAKEQKAELAKEEKTREAEISRLALEVRTKSAEKPVDCYDEPDNVKFIYRIIRSDTGEEIRTRPMDQDERHLAKQGRLFSDDEDDEKEPQKH